MFLIISLVFLFISLIAVDGNYQEKELKKDYKKYEEITNELYRL